MTAEFSRNPLLAGVGDGGFGALTVQSGRRVTGKGKADIGGRLRVAAILRRAGVSAPTPERIAGSTNEVWRAGDFIVRVGASVEVERLRREARLGDLLPWDVRYPPVVASGVESFGEWMVARNRPGVPLSEAWSTLERQERRSVVHELARAIKSVHSTHLSAEQQMDLAMDPITKAEVPHCLPVTRIFDHLEKAMAVPGMDAGLIRAVAERTESVATAFDGEYSSGLVHGDLHFENVLVRNGALVSVLDFEWCRPGPRELDLDVLARFCAHPDLTVAGTSAVDRDAYRPVLGWFNEAYPELFASSRLRERLMLCALSFEVPWLLSAPPLTAGSGDRFHPMNRLRDLLEQGTEAERLGWSATGI